MIIIYEMGEKESYIKCPKRDYIYMEACLVEINQLMAIIIQAG